ncbi:MAG: TlpA disulfide reductase family protein [Acidimicrobiales bacterium]
MCRPPTDADDEVRSGPDGSTRRRSCLCGRSPGGCRRQRDFVAAVVDDGGESGQLTEARAVPTSPFTRFDGTETSMLDYRGQKLVVNFFSSTCVPCKREMPDFERVARQAGDEVTFIGIDVQDGRAEGMAFVEQTGVTYDIGEDPTGELFNEFGGTVLPLTAFVAADGTVLDSHTGRLSETALRERISANLLGGG